MEIKLDKGFEASLRKLSSKLKKMGVDVNAAARRGVIKATKNLMDESITRSPVDEGDLENSHQMEIEGRGTKTSGTVYIPDDSPAGVYAEWIHEGTYNLGPGSLAKQAGQSEGVGPKFMERAFDEGKDDREQMVFDEIRKELD
jgi:HK97 gp10 family phage protein